MPVQPQPPGSLGDAAMNTQQLVAAFLQSRRDSHKRPSTIEWYEYVLLPFAASQPQQATAATIQEYLGTASNAESARNWLRAIRACYNWGARSPRHLPNPARDVQGPAPRRQLPRVLTNTELRHLMRAAQDDPINAAAITVLLDTGIRIAELASVKTEHIDIDALTVDGKVGQRRVPLSPEARQALMRIAAPMGPVFRVSKGARGATKRDPKPMATGTLKLRVRQCFADAGITGRKVGPHTLRHTFATMYLRAGGDIYRLQRILGHTKVTQTMVYLHLSDPEAFAEHARLSPLRQLSNYHQEELWPAQSDIKEINSA